MPLFAAQSIRRRLTRFMTLVTGVALVCMAMGFLSYEYTALRSAILSNTRAQAEVVASSTDAALEFGVRPDAEKILASIAVDKQVRMTCIFDQAGNLFAAYPPDAPPESLPSGPMKGADHSFSPGILEVSRPIVFENRTLGSVFIRTDLGEIRSRLVLTAWVLLVMVLVIFAGVYLAASALSKQIADPILVLSQTARTISLDKDYTIRLQQYFDHYLKGAPAPAWMEKGVPYIERERTELSTMSDKK